MMLNILKEITGSQARATLMEFFIHHEEREIQFNDLQKELGINPRQLTLQLKKLKALQLVKEKKVGNKKLYQANRGVFYFSVLQSFIRTLEPREEWFRWERASTIHHITLVAEAGMVPMKKYFGLCFPLTLMIFHGENVLWCNKIAEMSERGQQILDWYGQYKKSYERDILEAGKRLVDVFREIDSLDLKTLGKLEILEYYRKLCTTYVDWFALLWTTELVGIRCEEILKKRLTTEDISKLTALSHQSFSQEIEEAFEKLVTLVAEKQYDFQNKEFRIALQQFQKNYFWMHNNYFETKILEVEEIILDIKKRVQSKKVRQRDFTDVEAQKKELIKKLALDEYTQMLLVVSEQFTYWQDVRKKGMMMFAHYLELFLGEIGERAGISLHDMRYTFSHEVEGILGGTLKPDLKERQKHCLVVLEPGTAREEFFVGTQAKTEEKKYFGAGEIMTEEPILKGNVACSGKAIGTVKVLMNPSENYKVNHGDVLVTSMTSPDFMPSMRKCVALVTNEGGLTCHAAVISRELNIPCVIGTKNATKILKDGDRVEVDADKGLITLLV